MDPWGLESSSGSGYSWGDFAIDVGSALLTVGDIILGGPTGEGIGPAIAMQAGKTGVKQVSKQAGKAVGKTGRKINLKRANKWKNEIDDLIKQKRSATSKAEKKEIVRQLKHARRQLKKSEPHGITGQGY